MDLTKLEAAVEKNVTVSGSLIVLLKACQADPAVLAAIIAKLETGTTSMADVLVANTPSA